jgi:hypothetical protein
LLLLLRNHCSLLLYFAGRFEELVEQHRVHLIVAHAVGFEIEPPGPQTPEPTAKFLASAALSGLDPGIAVGSIMSRRTNKPGEKCNGLQMTIIEIRPFRNGWQVDTGRQDA